MQFDSDTVQAEKIGTSNRTEIHKSSHVKAPQHAIEEKMKSVIELGNYEAAYLFSEEGLPIAQATDSEANPVDQDQIAEMAILLQEVRKMSSVMAGISKLREIIIEGDNRRKIVFRFFESFGQSVVLSVVVPPKKSYRQRTNELEKLVVGESF